MKTTAFTSHIPRKTSHSTYKCHISCLYYVSQKKQIVKITENALIIFLEEYAILASKNHKLQFGI